MNKETIKQQGYAKGREMLAKLLPEGATIYHSFNGTTDSKGNSGYASRRKFYAIDGIRDGQGRGVARIWDITLYVCNFLDIRRDKYGHAVTRQTSNEIATDIADKLGRKLKVETI